MKLFPDAQCTLLDIDARMLGKAKKRIKSLKKHNVEVIHNDIRTAQIYDNCFDIIQSAFAISSLRNKKEFEQVMCKLWRGLKSNGVLIIGDYCTNNNESIKQISIDNFYFSIEKKQQLRYCDFSERYASLIRLFENGFFNQLPTLTQISILKNTGFSEVDILYKNDCFSVIYGRK